MIAIGNNNINGVFMGSTPVSKMYLGSVLVYGGDSPTIPPYTVRMYYNDTYEDIVFADGIANGLSGIDMHVEFEFGSGIWKFGEGCFQYNQSMTFRNSPSDLTTIAPNAFLNANLESLDISNLTIEQSAFKYSFLSSVTLNSGTTLTQVKTTSPEAVFEGDSSLRYLYWNGTEDGFFRWLYEGGNGNFTNYEMLFGSVPVSDRVKVVINDNESSLNSYFVVYNEGGDREYFQAVNGIVRSNWELTTMNREDIERVVVGEGVKELGEYAFHTIDLLTILVLPEGLERIGNYAFRNDKALQDVTIPATVRSIDTSAFEYCSGLTSVTIGDDVRKSNLEEIASDAFYGCLNLKEITCYAETAPRVYQSTFFNVASGGTLNYPSGSDYSSWLSTGEHYLGYYGWNNIVPLGEYEVRLTMSNGTTSSVTYSNGSIPNGTLMNSTFRKNKNIVGVEIGEKITSIGNYTFNECSNITSVTIGNSVRSIGNNAFTSCTGLTTITTPDSVTSIGQNAFSNCKNLTSVTIPDSVTSISSLAFNNIGMDVLYSVGGKLLCHVSTATTSFNIADGTEKIVGSAFSGCTNLSSVTIPDSVTSISILAFQNCTSLTSITIGNSVTSIADAAFKNCSSLYSITCNATTAPSITSGTFQIGHYFGTLYHPIGSDYSSWLSTSEYYLGYYSWKDGNVSEGGDGDDGL